jgi:N-acetylmuramate 1-kinase
MQELTQKIAQNLGHHDFHLQALRGDGSQKKIFRIHSKDTSYLLICFPHVGRQNYSYQAYKNIYSLLQSSSITVPKCLYELKQDYSLILEDCGDTHLWDILQATPPNTDPFSYFKQATNTIKDMLSIATSGSWTQSKFSSQVLFQELEFFVSEHIQANSKYQQATWWQKDRFFDEAQRLCDSIAKTSKYFVHRDFHSKNLMYKDNKLFVIDFQDARLGPASYDIVSLCFDPYLQLKPDQYKNLFNQSLKHLSNQISSVILDEITSCWQEVLLQRLLKVIGSYSYLSRTKHNSFYSKATPTAVKILTSLTELQHKWPYLSQTLCQGLTR